ncbi:phytanoyl-CoA dioxygenase family protein [Sphingomonas jatrophae]|uniref:Phytanoyl-CoA dioxygenase (PhyH) n=1 Tax=Sphingomonas jatrophae TaxID=1166337 RepID=A0A1I6M2V3_9SPHN|nr:phytanoyl-CoA dioxygenase family protein [Sphingomonas jatrophae]SFS10045.1 Phytanoyl-CoA dioxygenase (PhyH) [Sphingomonas jatrophae]
MLERLASDLPTIRGGTRMTALPAPVLDLLTGHLAAYLPGRPRPVRAVLFDKSADANWSLAWHQDRVITVRRRQSAPGFARWTVKAGLLHVEPPFELLARMITGRLHLDPVDADNAPLKVALGSHRLGKVADTQAATKAAALPSLACHAQPGDLWLYATPILHASDAARRPARRRVLQLDFSADRLPHGLEWAGVAPLETPPPLH